MSHQATNATTAMELPTRQHSAEKSKLLEVIGVNEFAIADSIDMSVEFVRKDRSGRRLLPFFRIGTSIRYNPTRVGEALAMLEEGGCAPKSKVKAKKSSSNSIAG